MRGHGVRRDAAAGGGKCHGSSGTYPGRGHHSDAAKDAVRSGHRCYPPLCHLHHREHLYGLPGDGDGVSAPAAAVLRTDGGCGLRGECGGGRRISGEYAGQYPADHRQQGAGSVQCHPRFCPAGIRPGAADGRVAGGLPGGGAEGRPYHRHAGAFLRGDGSGYTAVCRRRMDGDQGRRRSRRLSR